MYFTTWRVMQVYCSPQWRILWSTSKLPFSSYSDLSLTERWVDETRSCPTTYHLSESRMVYHAEDHLSWLWSVCSNFSVL